MNNEPNIQDVLEAINVFSSRVDQDMREVRKDIADIRATMATKEDLRQSEASTRDFVDRRISDVEAAFAPKLREVDEKDSALVDHLAKKAIIAKLTAADIQAMSPFAP